MLVTISDRKKGIADPLNAALIKFFEPVMLSGTDYYPFGMPMRIGGDSSYRYGFNGKENDNEVKGGDGLQQDYGMRVYDNRLGRFLSVDPVTQAYPWLTPYQFASNNPVRFVDLDGAESDDPLDQAQKGTTLLKIFVDTKDAAWNLLFTTAYPHSQGWLIKKLLSNQGHDAGDLDAIQLSQAFDVISEEGQFKVISERSFTEKLFTITFSTITVAGSLPSKGGGPYMAIKISPIVSTAISDILKGLKLSQEIKQGVKDIEKFADRAHVGQNLKSFEAESGAILQATHGIKLREIKEVGEKGDYAVVSGSINGKDLAGKTIDQLGIPASAKSYVKMKEFLRSIDIHLHPDKGVDYILLDGRNFTEAQRGQITEYLNKNHSSDLERVITIGF
ncbi:MAG: RHS repeat-associated core domain-containing protein [Pseudobacter sp.]|uniref:RHS repeat-associated core domain-containing protein n=1 Tax=Pseudobacter sp. TaxID=2045420 RepID=UPI003F80AE49